MYRERANDSTLIKEVTSDKLTDCKKKKKVRKWCDKKAGNLLKKFIRTK